MRKQSKRSYVIHARQTVAFVPHPEIKGLFVRTEASAVHVACPECAAVPGAPCSGAYGHTSAVHWRRRDAYKAIEKAEPMAALRAYEVDHIPFKVARRERDI